MVLTGTAQWQFKDIMTPDLISSRIAYYKNKDVKTPFKLISDLTLDLISEGNIVLH